MQAKSETNVKVIDVSHHQGSISWDKVKADGVQGAIIKATEGRTGIDLKFSSNATGAVSAGIKIGFYHYARPENNSPEDEAANFYRNVKGYKADFPHVLDVEGEASKIGAAALTKWCVKWLQEVERLTGHPAMVYTGASFAKTYLGKDLAAWPLWVAHYGVNKPMDNPTWPAWSVFQYTSSGSVKGITGNVDMNVMEKAFFDKHTKPVPAPVVEIVPKVVIGDKLVTTGKIIDGRMEAQIAVVLDAAGVPYHWDNTTKKLYLL